MRLKSIITVIALILIMFMSAIESSIISLALPTIKQDLNAGNLISLIFTAYFIALVIANPIVGELLSRFKIIYVPTMPIILYRNGISNANFGTICDNDINTPDPKPCITREDRKSVV